MIECSKKAFFHSFFSGFVAVYALHMKMAKSFLFLCFYIYLSSDLPSAQRYPNTVSLKNRWNNSGLRYVTDTFKFEPIVLWKGLGNTSHSDDNLLWVGAGFVCNNTYNRSRFAVVVLPEFNGNDPYVVWSANRNRLVGENATLELATDGDLVLKDSDGSLVWSTNTSHKGVLGMTIGSSGNLVLFNSSNQAVWQSFDHPTDALLEGQILAPGQKLVADSSPTNSSEGIFALSNFPGGFAMFAGAQMFYRYIGFNQTALYYLKLQRDGLRTLTNSQLQSIGQRLPVYPGGSPGGPLDFPDPYSYKSLKLMSDGRLNYYEWIARSYRETDFLAALHFCDYPGACKGYSICSNGECTCPEGDDAFDSFTPLNSLQPGLGCALRTPLAGCAAPTGSAAQHFLELHQVSYFNQILDSPSLISNSTTMNACKKICYDNCSCKSTFFVYYGTDESNGSCFLPSKVFSLQVNDPSYTHYNSYAFLKVQNRSTATSGKPQYRTIIAVVSAAAAGVVGAAGCVLAFLWFRRSKFSVEETFKGDDDDDDFDSQTVPGLLARFSYDQLRCATQNFSTKLGGGGFGSVFAGMLPDGTKIAVKRLEYSEGGQGLKEFRAEVQTIGGINHFNLVKLQGFCADQSHRLLVYEYLENGSLDKWLFSKNSKHTLDWNTRFKIALDSARGLAYLHGDCRERIIHLDIKPQNILLDEKFNAKISDFGMSKLMSRDESQVMTRVRGTPGYVAPELMKYSKLTEKADIYSFGVTLLEMVSGRRNVDLSATSFSDIFLLDILPQKAKEGKLMDVVDEHLRKEYENIEKEVLRVIRVGMWCILEDFRMRPAMSVVVKVLEGAMELEDPPLNFKGSAAPVRCSERTREDGCSTSSSSMLPHA